MFCILLQIIVVTQSDILHTEYENISINKFPHTLGSTVVDLSTRPAFFIIFHFFQIKIFMVSQQSFSYKKLFLKQ